MKKLILTLSLLATIVAAEDCEQIKDRADKWKAEADSSILNPSLIGYYGRANYNLSLAIYCQNKKILEKLQRPKTNRSRLGQVE